ncbi:MAG TPA: NGG1p interacting factor NIF3 [Candidatus Magasanikbacteria bacterium]|nr:NGG1p interacting factor NIF3 [Candidatus Magasanikbacteria bacterium]
MLTVKQIYELGLKLGMEADPRGKRGVQKYLEATKKEYENLSVKEKLYFDKNKLTNPYADSHIHVDDDKTQVKRVMAGIDIGGSEILLASQLGERKKPIDLVIAHHPVGRGLAGLHDVMDMQVEIYEQAGVPIHVAEKLMDSRVKEVGRSVHPSNHYQVVQMAELLKINLINTHTFTDNLVADFLTKLMAKRKPDTLGDVLDILMEIPEYQEAKRQGAGPNIAIGSLKSKVGRYLLEMTGGTEPGDKVYTELSRYGLSTIIGMHMREPSHKAATESHMNVVIAGHISSDSLGMNLFMDELEKKGIEIVPCSGLIRVSRNKKK